MTQSATPLCDKVFRIVSGTRVSPGAFETETALGRSLRMFRSYQNLQTEIYYNNSEGLSTIYNRSIRNAVRNPAILVFVHDDVYLADVTWLDKVQRALELFDIVGMAGNKRRIPYQPGWAFIDTQWTWDNSENLSGTVGHGEFPGEFSVYGPAHQSCKLLDGVMLICDSRTLTDHNLFLDPQFQFHFYDLDFCRQAELKGLKMGTASAKIIHQSGGAFGSEAWCAAYERYLKKYGS